MASLLSSNSRCAPAHYEGSNNILDLLKLRGAVPVHTPAVNPGHPTLRSVPGMGAQDWAEGKWRKVMGKKCKELDGV